MKRIVYVLILVLTFASCSQSGNDENAKEQIAKYKKEIKALEQKIAELEDDLPQEKTAKAVKVKTKEIELSAFKHFMEINGRVEARDYAFISPEANGQIKQIHIKEGERVKKGQLLVSLNDAIMQKSLSEMKNAYSLSLTLYKKQKELWDQKIGSEIQYLEAKNRKESLEKSMATLEAQIQLTRIYAPFSGIVEKVYQKKGEVASPGRQIIELVNLQNIKIRTNLSEAYLENIQKGDSVTVIFPYLSLEIPSVISRKGQVIDARNRTFEIDVELKNRDEKIKPNMMSTLRICDYAYDESLVVPSLTIGKDINGTYVYLAKKEGDVLMAKKSYINTAQTNKNATRVVSGISPGDQIIVEGYNQVRDRSFIDIIH